MTPASNGRIASILDDAVSRLERAAVPGPRREAEILLAHVLGTDRGVVVARRPDPLGDEAAARFEGLVLRRERREPLQYLTGEQEFMGLSFRVDPRVLVPRPETEGVVEAALALPPPHGGRVADLGTGSGCIAVAVAIARPDLGIVATDASSDALDVARENASRNGTLDRIEFILADFATPPPGLEGTFDAVLSNPPYVSEGEWQGLSPEVRDHEPRIALVPGETGLEGYEGVAATAARLLKPRGAIVLELGFKREEGARAAVLAAGLAEVRVLPDLRGIPRVLVARKRGA
jgi:release factor glutamine methyltransferase